MQYAFHQVARIPAQLRDQREFAEAAEADPFREVPAQDLLTGLRGKDVLFVFVESYGRVAIEGIVRRAGCQRGARFGNEAGSTKPASPAGAPS